MLSIESAGLTTVGKKRKKNEDAFLSDDHMKLYVVADGMGGHKGGWLASTMVIETIRDYLKQIEDQKETQEPENPHDGLSKKAKHLLSGIHLANQGIHKVSVSNPSYHGMGTTIPALYFTDKTLVAANVGDSPIYLIHKGDIEALSVSHTVAAEHTTLNLGGDNPLGYGFEHVLTRAVGVGETVDVHILETPCYKGDILVLCSDGLSNKVLPEEILAIVSKTQPQTASRSLIDLANERGGDDNATVIVLKIKGFWSRRPQIKALLSPVGQKLALPFRKVFQ